MVISIDHSGQTHISLVNYYTWLDWFDKKFKLPALYQGNLVTVL